MNSRLELFNKRLVAYGVDAEINGCLTKVLVRDTDNKDLKETKHIFVPIEVVVGDTIIIENNKYMVLNTSSNDVYTDCLVEEMYHTINVQYSWLPLMVLDVKVNEVHQQILNNSQIVLDTTRIELHLQRNETTKQLMATTRFFLFNAIYEIESITYPNSNILVCRCVRDVILPQDNVVNQIADNSHFTPPIKRYAITASAGANGTISPTGEVEVEEGKSQTFTITSNEGYEVDTVVVDGVSVSLTDNQYTFTGVSANATISVTFKEKPVVVLEIQGKAELYPTEVGDYELVGVVNPTTSWSVSSPNAQLTIVDNTHCKVKNANATNSYVTLTADIGTTKVTKEIMLMRW